MNKERILQKIKAAAKANGGSPLGIDRFENETGIKEWDWQKHWPRWSDAVREAGFTPNKLTVSYSEIELLNKYAVLTKELGKLPTHGDLLFKTHNDSTFPTEKTFRRFGGKALLIKQLAEFCKTRSEHKIVADLCAAYVIPKQSKVEETVYQVEEFGFVYLIKSGRFFKINSVAEIPSITGCERPSTRP